MRRKDSVTIAPATRTPSLLSLSLFFLSFYYLLATDSTNPLPSPPLLLIAVNAMVIENFRPVSGTTRIYRCAKTEPLANIIAEEPSSQPEIILSTQTGLIVDLRSPIERDETKTQQWMARFAFQATEGTDTSLTPPLLLDENDNYNDNDNLTKQKRVLRLDVQPRDKVIRYLDDTWLTPSEKALSKMYFVFDAGRLHSLRMDVLNQRGLAGLNEAILQVGKSDLCVALREITRHLETQDSGVAFHCVKGKDRTGVMAMLLQSILGATDGEIIDEYHRSDAAMRDPKEIRTGDNRVLEKGNFCKNRFAGAPREAMVDTLVFIRQKYGSVCPGYLDSIGFDAVWRKRFLQTQQHHRRDNSNPATVAQ